MLSAAILIPAVLNGLLMGAVYALVALGLTLVYGVLHIINFAHGALLTAAMFAAFFAFKLLGIDPYVALFLLAPLFFALGYGVQRFVIGPASHGDDRNILLVTLGLPSIIENALLDSFRGDTRTIDVPYAFEMIDLGLTLPGGAARCRLRRGLRGGAGAVAADDASPIPARRSARWPRRSSAPRWSASTSRHVYAVTFGLGAACLAIAACLLMPTFYVNPRVGNAFVLVAFTIVVLGGMGSVPGRADRRPGHRRGGEPVRPLSRREPRPDRHLPDLHPRAAGAARPACSERAHERSRPTAIVRSPLLAARAAGRARSNAALNFLVFTLIIALAAQGWNILGGYGGQYLLRPRGVLRHRRLCHRDPAGALRRQRLAGLCGRHRGRAALVRLVIGSQRSGPGCAAPISRWSRSPSPRCCASWPTPRPSPAARRGIADQARRRPRARSSSPSRAAFFWVVARAGRGARWSSRELIERSRFGAWLVAVRENEDAAAGARRRRARGEAAAMTISGCHHRRGGLLLRAVLPLSSTPASPTAPGSRSRRCSPRSSAALGTVFGPLARRGGRCTSSRRWRRGS